MTALDECGPATAWRRQDSAPLSTSAPPPCTFSVRVEFDQLVADEDLLADLSGNPRHRLLDYLPQISTNNAGQAEIELIIPGTDVWTSILTAMTVTRQSGYDPAAVHVTSGQNRTPYRPPEESDHPVEHDLHGSGPIRDPIGDHGCRGHRLVGTTGGWIHACRL